MHYFADVILPVPLPGLFTYSVPDALLEECMPGKRVIVQFGKKKIYSAIVKRIHQNTPHYETKPVISVLDNVPIVHSLQFQFWDWMADYYMCNLSDIYKAALPAGLKLESETNFVLTKNEISEDLSDTEKMIIAFLKDKNAGNISDLTQFTKSRKTMHFLQKLMKKGIIVVEECVNEAYKPKYESFIELHPDYHSEAALKLLFESLTKAAKQLEILMFYVHQTSFFQQETRLKGLSKKTFVKTTKLSIASLNALIKKGIFLQTENEISRLEQSFQVTAKKPLLTDFQSNALMKIKKSYVDQDVVLLHGVTSSGKTEVYIQLMAQFVSVGKQVLYLLPEIAITTQIINRLRSVFGNMIGVYHSKFSDSERVEIFYNLLQDHSSESKEKYQIILGVRSSIFLPFSNLGLIIVDEEHENTYKQFDPAPRYHARDAAIVLGKIHQAKILLGTATPSFESYMNAQQGKYALVELKQRFGDMELPEIIIADQKTAERKKIMKSLFTPELYLAIDQAFKNKEQVILFQNRRGFSIYLECKTCDHVPQCKNCDVSLSYHKRANQLICHYCGFSSGNTGVCPSCGDHSLITRGFGTEKVEDEIALLFPEARVARMDYDSTRKKHSLQSLISDFENGVIEMLIGTQMVSKGLDFGNVSTVGVMDADSMINFPDFRAWERSFQLIAQVSGRAGRKNKRGRVIIQTSQITHSVIKHVLENDFEGLYKSQIGERIMFHYPPVWRMIMITLKHKKLDMLNDAANFLAKNLRLFLQKSVLGPQEPPVAWIQNWHLKNIIIKLPKNKELSANKQKIAGELMKLKTIEQFRSVLVLVDVDPA